MKLVEVIAGGNTPAELVDYIKNLSTEIGKTPVVVNEAPGFVVNKILIPYCNEGVCVLQEGVASAEDIRYCVCSWLQPPHGSPASG